MTAPLLIAALAALVTASAELTGGAALDSSRVLGGELWRLFSGHLAHLSWRHFLMDVPVFVALHATLDRRSSRSRVLGLMLFSSLSVSVTVVAAGMHEVYGGLSGLSCAAAGALLAGMVREQPSRPIPWLLVAAFCWYLLSLEGIASGVAVAHEAHLAGALSGALFAFLSPAGAERVKVPTARPSSEEKITATQSEKG